MIKRWLAVFRNEQGQTTIEWAILSIMLVMTLLVVGVTFANSLPPVFEAFYQKIVEIANSIGL